MSTTPETGDLQSAWMWYHVVLTTPGAWVFGDPRNLRENSAPGACCRLERVGWVAPSRGRVQLPPPIRPVVGTALRDGLAYLGAEVTTVSVAAQHAHILARMPQGLARRWTSAAKLYAACMAAVGGWGTRLWGKRSKAVPVRIHPRQVRSWILRHRDRNAWVWSDAETLSYDI